MSLLSHYWTISPRLRHAVRPVLRSGGHVAFPRRARTGLGEGEGVDAQLIAWLRGR